ncbi:hypothetical protein RhiirB3_403184 [Rhizophagus irregularis]|nr:hypothetical protein RhiirB3_403184 [Rhizophagus irregularis]
MRVGTEVLDQLDSIEFIRMPIKETSPTPPSDINLTTPFQTISICILIGISVTLTSLRNSSKFNKKDSKLREVVPICDKAIRRRLSKSFSRVKFSSYSWIFLEFPPNFDQKLSNNLLYSLL